MTEWEEFVESVNSKNVFVKNPGALLDKLNTIAREGLNNFQVISDFDGTVTAHHSRTGKRCFSCHGVIGKYHKFSDAYRTEVQAMENRFGPKEKDPKISEEERLQVMHDWWAQSHALMIAQNISLALVAEMVEDAVAKETFGLRENFRDFSLALRTAHVPMVVLSAGISIVIEELFKRERIPVDDLTMIVSNQTISDQQGVLVAFVEPVLHGMSKKYVLKEIVEKSVHRKSRSNVLVLGDMPHDYEVADLLEISTKISIGFLTDASLLHDYMEIYDVVLTEDQGFDFAASLFRALTERAGEFDRQAIDDLGGDARM